MRRLTITLAVAGAVLLSAPAFAQTPQSNNNSVTVTAQSGSSLDEVLCRNEPPPTGTRTGGKRVCKTNRQWLRYQDALNRQRGMNANTDFTAGPGPGGTSASR